MRTARNITITTVIIMTIIVFRKPMRHTIHARSLEVLSYHLDAPMRPDPVHAFRFCMHNCSLLENSASHRCIRSCCIIRIVYINCAPVIECSLRHSYSISFSTYTVHRSVFCMKAPPYAVFSRLCAMDVFEVCISPAARGEPDRETFLGPCSLPCASIWEGLPHADATSCLVDMAAIYINVGSICAP